MMESLRQQQRRRFVVATCILSVLADAIADQLMASVLPFWLPQDFGCTNSTCVTLFAMYRASGAVAEIISMPMVGLVADRVGSLRTLLGLTFGSAVGLFLQASAQSSHMLLIGRAVAGIFGGAQPVSRAALAAEFPNANAIVKVQSNLANIMVMSAFIWPVTGLGLAQLFSYRAPLIFGALFAFLAWSGLCLWCHVLGADVSRRLDPVKERRSASVGLYDYTKKDIWIAILLAGVWCAFLGVQWSFGAIIPFTLIRLSLGMSQVTAIGMAAAIVSIVMRTLTMHLLLPRIGALQMPLFGFAIQVVAYGAFILAVGGYFATTFSLVITVVLMVVLSFGSILSAPVISVLSTHYRKAFPREAGLLQGLTSSCAAGFRAAIPLVATSLFAAEQMIILFLGLSSINAFMWFAYLSAKRLSST